MDRVSAATQGTKTMIEAIECEKQRDRYWQALTDIAIRTAELLRATPAGPSPLPITR